MEEGFLPISVYLGNKIAWRVGQASLPVRKAVCLAEMQCEFAYHG